ncbi:PAS domain-containing protein [Roseisolibacter sp. H3M3-2]|uniref:PAS domain-containing protein n=1 Tax=Roseisolibacter sp. H3M3-2 TaxID=3031323 RepID=UPI0023DA6DF2|nr:PAS domain-containing protein [Roseisolibacter sp. H3M3-2]MDF1501747.1 PAS domain-containing protein [Roseisolibacter sp. H3M3-2]
MSDAVPLEPVRPAPALPPDVVARMFEGVSDAVVCVDREWRFTYLNARAGVIVGREPRTLLGRVVWDEFPELVGTPLHAAAQRALLGGEPARVESRLPGWGQRFDNRLEPFGNGLVVIATARRDADAADAGLVERSRYLRAILDTAPECVSVIGRDRAVIDMNAAGLAMVGAESLAALRGRDAARMIAPADREAFARLHDAVLAGGSGRLEYVVEALDGRRPRVESDAAPLHDAAGRIVGALHVSRDVTARREAEERLRRSEAFNRLLLEASPDCIKVLGLDGRLERINPTGLVLLEADDAAALHGHDWETVWEGEARGLALAAMEAARAGGSARFQAAAPTVKGTPKHWDVSVTPVRDEAGAIVRLLAVSREITEAKHAEARLRESETRFRTLAEAAPLGVFMNDPAGRTVYLNQRAAEILGHPMEALLGAGWARVVHPDDLARAGEMRRAFREGDAELGAAEWRTVRADGAVRQVTAHAVRLRGPDGATTGYVGMLADVTDQRALEAQLRQAQKMDAVGQLAGGIAHDFNNLLTVIVGHLDFAREDVGALAPADHALHDDLAEIARAADRARALVRQLLAFSRRQVVAPRAVDLGEVVRGAEQLLRRVLGDEIVLGAAPGPAPAVVRADAVQLEQVLVNLALNARDAMLTPAHGHPGTGGTLTIETELVALDAAAAAGWGLAPGEYARLGVRDSGHGMDEATRAHLFEPFFTTKPVGAGTGLGLATVYGIVQQAGGAIRVDSAPGAGTTVTILLPRVAGAPDARTVAPGARPAAGRGTVLVVEDESPVRATTRRVLERHGYAVLEARHGADALLLWARHRDAVDAVVTDLRMPEMGGRALVARLRADRPDLPVVYVSGYSDEATTAAALPCERYVEKPFAGEALLAAVAEALAAR